MNFLVIRFHKKIIRVNEKRSKVGKSKRDRWIGTYNENAPDFTINTYNAKCVKLLITTTTTTITEQKNKKKRTCGSQRIQLN